MCSIIEDNADNKEDIDFEFIESYMGKYVGGEIYIGKEHWDEGIAIIYINRPEKKNAITGNMIFICIVGV